MLLKEIARFKGAALDRVTFQHPFLERSILGVLATYVTADTGTGAVHTAPSHGADDFYTGQRYCLDATTRVDASGRIHVDEKAWPHTVLPPFEGKTVWAANPIIVAMLKERGALLASAPTSATPTPTAGAVTIRSSSAPPSSGSSAWKHRSSAKTAPKPPSASSPSKRSTKSSGTQAGARSASPT